MGKEFNQNNEKLYIEIISSPRRSSTPYKYGVQNLIDNPDFIENFIVDLFSILRK